MRKPSGFFLNFIIYQPINKDTAATAPLFFFDQNIQKQHQGTHSDTTKKLHCFGGFTCCVFSRVTLQKIETTASRLLHRRSLLLGRFVRQWHGNL